MDSQALRSMGDRENCATFLLLTDLMVIKDLDSKWNDLPATFPGEKFVEEINADIFADLRTIPIELDTNSHKFQKLPSSENLRNNVCPNEGTNSFHFAQAEIWLRSWS